MVTRAGVLRVARVAAYGLVVVLGGIGVLRVERQQDALEAETLARREEACGAADETRDLIRELVRDGGVASGQAGGEAIIEVSAGGDEPPDPEVIAVYRRVLLEQLGPALDQIVDRLPGREWDPEHHECVDVPVGDEP